MPPTARRDAGDAGPLAGRLADGGGIGKAFDCRLVAVVSTGRAGDETAPVRGTGGRGPPGVGPGVGRDTATPVACRVTCPAVGTTGGGHATSSPALAAPFALGDVSTTSPRPTTRLAGGRLGGSRLFRAGARRGGTGSRPATG